MVGGGIRGGMLEPPETFKVWISLGDPDVMRVKEMICAGTFSLITTPFNASSVGGRFKAGLMVTENVRVIILLLKPPSLTVTEMVVVPLILLIGTKVRRPVVLGLV